MNSIAAGTMPSPMMAATQAPASGTASKLASMVRVTGAFLMIRTVASTTMPSKPSEPVIRPSRSRPARARRLAAQGDDLAARQHEFDAQQIVGGEAIFQAMQPAGVFRDIAADGAGDLAGRIGRIIKAFAFDRAGDGGIGDARLQGDAAIFVIDLEDAAHPPHADQDAVGARQRAAGERGARAARHDRHARLGGIAQNGGNLFGVLGSTATSGRWR